MKKKMTVCILLLAMLVTVTACGKSNEDSDDDSSAKDELVPKHTYVDGVCTDCGQCEPSEGLEFEEITDGKRNVIGYAVSGIGTCTDTDIVLPVSLTSIGGGTFNHCPSLTNIVYNGTVEQLKAIDCEAISNAYPIKCTDGSIDDYWTGKEE